MHAPQIIVICLWALGLGIDLAKHGEEKTGLSSRHNAVTTLVGIAIVAWLLWWGGFFSP